MSTPQTNIVPKTDDKITTLAKFLSTRREQLQKIALKGFDVERATKIVLANAAKTPRLLECTPQSIYESMRQATEMGIEPGGALQHGYLVPYGATCQLIVSYKGLVMLARRSGEISTIEARAVHAKDHCVVDMGTDPKIVHRPSMDNDRGPTVAVYAVATMRDGTKQFDVMTAAEVDRIKQRSKAASSGPWVTDHEEMSKKTVVRRLAKMLPLTIEAEEAIAREESTDLGLPTLYPVSDVTPTLAEGTEPEATTPAEQPVAAKQEGK